MTVSDTLELVLIAAVAEDGTIGDDGSIPWHHPEDLRHFRQVTLGSPVIMGRKTYESIVDRLGHALDGRTNIVLTSRVASAVVDVSDRPDGETDILVASSIDAAIARAGETGASTAYVIGGASIYEQFLPEADGLIITEVPGRFDGDTTFPVIDTEVWEIADRTHDDPLTYVTYRRRRSDRPPSQVE